MSREAPFRAPLGLFGQFLETVRKGVRVELRALIWSVYRAKTGRIAPLRCPERPRLTPLRDFSDSFLTEFSEVRTARSYAPILCTLCYLRSKAARVCAATVARWGERPAPWRSSEGAARSCG